MINGFVCNALSESISSGIAPGFPYCIEITDTDNQKFMCHGIMRTFTQDEYRIIPII